MKPDLGVFNGKKLTFSEPQFYVLSLVKRNLFLFVILYSGQRGPAAKIPILFGFYCKLNHVLTYNKGRIKTFHNQIKSKNS